jgi:hypothetical protein
MLEANRDAPTMNHPAWRPARKYPVEVSCVVFSRRVAQMATPNTRKK